MKTFLHVRNEMELDNLLSDRAFARIDRSQVLQEDRLGLSIGQKSTETSEIG